MREFEHVRVQSARNEWRHFPPLCALFATSFPLSLSTQANKKVFLDDDGDGYDDDERNIRLY